jgi:hypothetical protein
MVLTKDQKRFAYCLGIYLAAAALAFFTGCATQSTSRVAGVAIGSVGGAAIGGVLGSDGNYQTRNVIIGATLGGVAGGLMGDHFYNKKEQEKKDAFLKGQRAAPVQGQAPNVKPPKVETYWIEGKVVGNRYIEGHYEYVISEPSRWDVE